MNTTIVSKNVKTVMRTIAAGVCSLALVGTMGACGSSGGKVDERSKTATSVADFGGMDALEKAAKAEKPAKAAAPKKPVRSRAQKETDIIIQSPLGGEITPFAIFAKVGDVDKVYIRVDKNKAYWVKGSETGSVDLW